MILGLPWSASSNEQEKPGQIEEEKLRSKKKEGKRFPSLGKGYTEEGFWA